MAGSLPEQACHGHTGLCLDDIDAPLAFGPETGHRVVRPGMRRMPQRRGRISKPRRFAAGILTNAPSKASAEGLAPRLWNSRSTIIARSLKRASHQFGIPFQMDS